MNHHVYCISAGRPANVPAMQALFQPDPLTWVVPHPERHDYTAAGAHHVLPVHDPPPGRYALSAARNAALDHAMHHGRICIQTDDDATAFHHLPNKDTKPTPTTWFHVRQALLEGLDGTAHLSGVPPTENPYFARAKRLNYGFIIGSLCATDTPTPRWDETLPFKEDYDYTCAHIEAHGRIARMDNWLASYRHYSNRGGAVANRTTEAENTLVAALSERWPHYLRPHPTRPSEISFIPQPKRNR